MCLLPLELFLFDVQIYIESGDFEARFVFANLYNGNNGGEVFSCCFVGDGKDIYFGRISGWGRIPSI